jgi:phage gp46-like protein
MSDRRIDPVTGTFVSDGRGGFERCEVIENQIAFSYMIEEGSWEGDAELGHRFRELARAENTATNRLRLADLARQAIQWLIDDGSVESVEVTVDDTAASRPIDQVPFEVDYYLPGAQQPRKAGPFLLPVGAG